MHNFLEKYNFWKLISNELETIIIREIGSVIKLCLLPHYTSARTHKYGIHTHTHTHTHIQNGLMIVLYGKFYQTFPGEWGEKHSSTSFQRLVKPWYPD